MIVQFENANILVAEDNTTNQIFIDALLKKMGLNCTIAKNGIEVLELLGGPIQYQLILMDCQMPDLDGFGATMQVREAEKTTTKRIPIIALTANVSAADRRRCLECGMDDFLAKPLKREALVKALSQFLQIKQDSI